MSGIIDSDDLDFFAEEKRKRDAKKETVLFNEKGMPVAVEVEEYSTSYPLSHSFKDVNDFIHNDVDYEELQCLCLGLATELDNLKERFKTSFADGEENKAKEVLKGLYGA